MGLWDKLSHSRDPKIQKQKNYPTLGCWVNLTPSLNNVHEDVRFNCQKCDKSFSRRDNLKLHVRIVHDNLKQHKCDHSYSIQARTIQAQRFRPHDSGRTRFRPNTIQAENSIAMLNISVTNVTKASLWRLIWIGISKAYMRMSDSSVINVTKAILGRVNWSDISKLCMQSLKIDKKIMRF